MKSFAALVSLLLFSISAFASVKVSLTSPASSTAVSSPLTIKASASSDRVVTGWRIHLDNRQVFAAGSTSTIATALSAAAGSHVLAVRAWDSSGAYDTAYSNLTVSAGAVAPEQRAVGTATVESVEATDANTPVVRIKVGAPLKAQPTLAETCACAKASY